MILNYLRRQK